MKRDGLRLMLMSYRNFGRLSQVEKATGVPVSVLKGFIDKAQELTPEQDKSLREPLKEFGGTIEIY